MLLGSDALGRFALGQLPEPAASTQTFSGMEWPDIVRKAGLSVAVVATSFVGFVPPPQAQAAPPFTQFSQPLVSRNTLPDEQPNTLFEVAPPPVVTLAFSQFSQPLTGRTFLTDEQPSALFEVAPPPVPPFTGFAQFSSVIRAKARVDLLTQFTFTPTFTPADTHDLVFMGDQFRKKKRKDPIDEELARKAKLRAALELAVYGPEVTYEPPAAVQPPKAAPPPNVEDLAKAIVAARTAHLEAQRKAVEQDDEDVIEMMLKDL